MLINHKQLKKVRVQTQSGDDLGLVSDFELETDTGTIEKYWVNPLEIFGEKLLIAKNQIVDFGQDLMIVEDGVIKIKESRKEILAKAKKLESAQPVINSAKE